jgi:hypothetical protein
LKHTDAEHADHRQLLRLSGELQNMADRINEVKRRKEVVEGIVGGRKRSVDVSKLCNVTGLLYLIIVLMYYTNIIMVLRFGKCL